MARTGAQAAHTVESIVALYRGEMVTEGVSMAADAWCQGSHSLTHNDLPPLTIPLVMLVLPPKWPREPAADSEAHYAAGTGCIPCAIFQSRPLPRSAC